MTLPNIKTILIVSALSIITGFGAGYYFKGLQVDSATLKEVKVVEAKNNASNAKSGGLSRDSADNKDAIQTKYKTIYKEIIKYVPETPESTLCYDNSGNPHSLTLSVGAVQLLNSTDPTSGIQPTAISDAESETPSDVGLREMSEYIATIKEQYEKLADDHNTLVEYDTWYQNETKPK